MIQGGECNYLLRARVDVGPDGVDPRVRLEEVDPRIWKDGRGVRWHPSEVERLLTSAEGCLRRCAEQLELDVLIIRKERAVGIIADPSANEHVPGAYGGTRLSYEVLEEIALLLQAHLKAEAWGIPYCCFNGGHDVFLDIGDKSLGIRALQRLVGATPESTIHCGDRFTRTGNDLRARDVANTLWVTQPAETEFLLTLLTDDMRRLGRKGGGGAGARAAPGDAPRLSLSELIERLPPPMASSRSTSPMAHATSGGSLDVAGGAVPGAQEDGERAPFTATLHAVDAEIKGGSSGLLHSTIPAPFPVPSAPPAARRRPSVDVARGVSLNSGMVPSSSPSRAAAHNLPAPFSAQRHWPSHASVSSLGAASSAPLGSPSTRGGIGTGFAAALLGNADDTEAVLQVGLGRPIDAALASAALRTQWESAGGVVVGEVRGHHGQGDHPSRLTAPVSAAPATL